MSHLKSYGLRLIENNPSILESRKVGFLDKQFYNINSIIDLDLVDLDVYRFQVVKKVHSNDYSMKWHLDDAQIISHKKDAEVKDQEFISKKKSIHYNNDPPEYSMIIYDSEYDVDFKGGILEFCDGFKVYPKKNMYVFFDSRLVHMVHKMIEGVRVNFLIKFYKKT